jgi:DNA-binding Lrp family transcriptional regulator
LSLASKFHGLKNRPEDSLMIVNNLLIKLKNRSPEAIEKVKAKLLGLEVQIPELLEIAVKTDLRGPQKSDYDLMLIAKFASVEDLAAYLGHPAHAEVAEFIKAAMESGASLRYTA